MADELAAGLSRIAGSQAVRTAGEPATRNAAGGPSFAESLARETHAERLRFSAHASRRMASRNLSLSAEELGRIEQAADLAAQRGSRDALLMLDDLGLVVNVRNRTVRTALDLKQMNDGIVTNIDSTVLVNRSQGK